MKSCTTFGGADSSMETLLTMERLLIADKAGVREALQAAYRLGVLDGQLQMAAVGQKAVESVLGDLA